MLTECHINSQLKPTTESRANLIVLSYGSIHVFVRTPKTYQDLETLARSLFNLGKTDFVSFDVPGVDICDGNSVKISECAWEDLSALVSVVVVRVKSASHIRRARLSGTGLLTPPAAGSPSSGGVADKDTEGNHGERVKDENVSVRFERANAMPDADEDAEDQRQPSTSAGIQRHGVSNRSIPRSFRENAEGADEDVVEDDNGGESNPTQVALPSASDVDTDGEDDDEDQDTHEGEVPQQALDQEHDHDPEQVAHNPVTAKQEEVLEEDLNTQIDQSDYVEDKFIVEVHHSVKGKRKFRVRARHHVSKLLSAVCQDFELDIDRAHLTLIVEFAEDGVLMEQDFECDENETIGQCGIKQGSKLVIRIDNE